MSVHHHLTQGNLAAAMSCIEPVAEIDHQKGRKAQATSPKQNLKQYISTSISQATPRRGDKLRRTFSAPNSVSSGSTVSAICDEQILQQALHQLVRDGGPPGPSGWTAQQVEVALTQSDSAFQTAFELVNKALQGNLPQLPELFSSTMSTLQKHDGTKRVVSHPEPWLQLFSRCAALSAAAQLQVQDALLPQQLCFQDSKAAQSFSHAVQAGAVSHPSGPERCSWKHLTAGSAECCC